MALHVARIAIGVTAISRVWSLELYSAVTGTEHGKSAPKRPSRRRAAVAWLEMASSCHASSSLTQSAAAGR